MVVSSKKSDTNISLNPDETGHLMLILNNFLDEMITNPQKLTCYQTQFSKNPQKTAETLLQKIKIEKGWG
jgi:hypothetical protein